MRQDKFGRRPDMPHLFSYGTLQLPRVQMDTFGRPLKGEADTLIGFRLERVEITDPAVLKSSGEAFHPIVVPSDDTSDTVSGTVFEITEQELARADHYEVEDYKRVEVALVSGRRAWLYVKA